MSEGKLSTGKRSWWERLWRPGSIWLLGIPLGAYLFFMVGAVAVIGSEVVIHATGSEKFCTTACHSMEAYPTPEWLDSPHSNNTSGVRATCSDCHIPHTYPEKLFVKAKSSFRDIYHELLGTVDTREKYEANRARLAENVWVYMEKTDSRECRNCHDEDYFLLVEQEDKAIKGHLTAPEEGKTCIDCHKGIAHRTPDEIVEEQERIVPPG